MKVEIVMQIVLKTTGQRIGSEIFHDVRNVDRDFDCDRTAVELIDTIASVINHKHNRH